jgi:peptidoglycan/LPS O-acetylase OafA/YrhL
VWSIVQRESEGVLVRSETDRIAGLDVLRGGAAAAVMIHHHAQYYDVLYPGRAPLPVDLGAGHFGVELFFIISGFVILMTIERKRTVLDFALSRFGRLMPAFVAAMAIATLILMVRPMPPLHTPTIMQFFANLTMAPALFGQDNIDLPYWTLTYELVFYVLMALVLWFNRLQSIEWLGLLLLGAGFLAWAFVDIPAHRRLSIVSLVHYSNFFLIGICLYRLHARTARAITWVALVCAIAASARGGGEQAFYASSIDYLLLTVAFAGLVWFASGRYGHWLVWRPAVFLGRISYPLYLVHVAVGYQIILFGVMRGWSTATGVVVACAASLALATLLHYLVELPGQRWARVVLQRPLTRRSMADTAE